MKYIVCAYKDVELEKFNPAMFFPFQSINDVIESVTAGVVKGKIEGAEALELFHLGSYDTLNASFDLFDKPLKILNLKDYVRKAD